MAMTLRPLTSAVGVEVGNVDLAALTAAEFAHLLAFSRRLGELDPPPNQERGRQSPPGYPDIYVVSNVLDEKGEPIGALGAGEAVWHTDMSYLDLPPDASMLYSLEIPPTGGNTHFCGMQALWQALPEQLQANVRTRRIKHDGTFNSGGYVRQVDVAEVSAVEHRGLSLRPDINHLVHP